MIAVLALSLATAAAAPDDAAEEVVIYGELLVEQARQKVIAELAAAGYDQVVERNGRTIYRSPEVWRGQVVLHDDGYMAVERQPVRVVAPALPFAEENSAVAWVGCILWAPVCIRPGGQTVGKRKYRTHEGRIVGRVHDDVEAWSDRIADLAIDRKLERLPDQLEALWVLGVPLDGGARLETHAERRLALMRYWGSRTDTPWGESVRTAVEAFCRAVVQPSDHPFPQAEIDAFNASSRAARPFSLQRTDPAR